VLAPSELGMTFAVEPSMTATHELVVPRSMPITFAMFTFLFSIKPLPGRKDPNLVLRGNIGWNSACAMVPTAFSGSKCPLFSNPLYLFDWCGNIGLKKSTFPEIFPPKKYDSNESVSDFQGGLPMTGKQGNKSAFSLCRRYACRSAVLFDSKSGRGHRFQIFRRQARLFRHRRERSVSYWQWFLEVDSKAYGFKDKCTGLIVRVVDDLVVRQSKEPVNCGSLPKPQD